VPQATRNGVGLVFMDVKDSIAVTENSGASKSGEACATNILSLFSTGDMSIHAAKRAGNITKVATVDYSTFSLLGIFSRNCAIVRGE